MTASVEPITERRAAWLEKQAARNACSAEREAAYQAIKGVQLGLILESIATGSIRFAWTTCHPCNTVMGKSLKTPGAVRVVAAFPARKADVEALRNRWRPRSSPMTLVKVMSDGWMEPTPALRAAIIGIRYDGAIGAELKRFLNIAALNGKQCWLTTAEKAMARMRWTNITRGASFDLPDYGPAMEAAKRYQPRQPTPASPADDPQATAAA